MSLIKINQVQKSFGKTIALDKVSFDIDRGETIAILGESGSGKSTLLRLVAGFEIPDSGEIILKNKTLVSEKAFVQPEDRKIGMVFQDYALFPHLNVAQNISYGLKGRKNKTRLNELLNLVAMDGYEKRYPHQISGGQQQRVAIARALATSPEVILLDEPFSNLDQTLKHEVRSQIKSILDASKTTTIFVTHDITDAVEVADKIAVLETGHLIQFDTPKDIYERPKTRSVARLFGDIFELGYAPTGTGFQFGSLHVKAPEEDVKAAVRLENIKLFEDESGQQKGVVTLTKWAGPYLRIQVETESGKVLTVRHDKPLDPGTTVSLSVDEDQIFWIKAQ